MNNTMNIVDKGVGGQKRTQNILSSVNNLANKDSKVKTAVININANGSNNLEYKVIFNDFDSDFVIYRYETGRYIISNSDLFSDGAERGGRVTADFYGGNTPISYVELLDSYQPGEAGIDCYKVTGYIDNDPVLVRVDSMGVVLTIKRYY